MQKTIIVNIPMTTNPFKTVYISDDKSVPASDGAFSYPVISFLGKNIKEDDEIKFVLIAKKSIYSKHEQYINEFKEEFDEINSSVNAKASYVIIDSDFEEFKYVHEKLLSEIVDNIDNDSHLIADITYGPKDLPIVVFSALGFAEKFLGCAVDNILYGQGVFNEEGIIENTKLCDMSPLYSLTSLTNTIKCGDPDKARKILQSIISV